MVEQKTTVCRSPAFSRQWRITSSVTGARSMMSATSVMSKSALVLRTDFNSSCTPTSMTKVRGGTRWPDAINSPRRTWSATLSKTSRSPLRSPRVAYRVQELAYGGLKPETVKRLEALTDYGRGIGLLSETSNAHVIFYYGLLSLPLPLAISGDDLDEHFQFPVHEAIELVNAYFVTRLSALIEQED
ncbi:hypothetical protein GCM10016455_05210 [Aliiroseovarius zhejiangensis]|uniref:DUF3786 domain-containing protein n=1 Tax=Aliiroseovarius zhejiangensis TaxID=1632025 RepID=A0ABQ3IMM5_9RHOB|nr:hypothetical protein [Aliiroseovarius zhejiangensis]GHE88087.1 hypothetical protein GCM10016455_05210 [Aliiroseovarius zhejiangensis]